MHTNPQQNSPQQTGTFSAPTSTASTQYQQILGIAQQLYARNPDWVTFFREVLGIDGLARRTFPNFDDLAAFERSPEFAEVQKMVVRLRENKASADSETEPTRVITVRLPKSMHEYLRTEAHDLRTSMNKLCISKLLQVVEQDMIPAERTAPPKRRAATPPTPSAPAATTHPSQQPVSSYSSAPTSQTTTPGVDSPFKGHFGS